MNAPTFGIAAQVVIPALFLALVPAAHSSAGSGLELAMIALGALFLVPGEAAAIHALSSTDARESFDSLATVVEICMTGGALSVFVLMTAPRIAEVWWMRGQATLSTVFVLAYAVAIVVLVLVVISQ
jgi:hypothetical protein